MTLILDNHRRATWADCTCGARVLAGVDADRCAFNAAVDNSPLTRRGELLAVVAGRRTYELADGRLYRRDRWSIRSTPRGAVLAEHDCTPIPAGWRLPPAPRPPAPVPVEF